MNIKKGQFKLRSKVNHLLTAAGHRVLPDPAAVQPLWLVAALFLNLFKLHIINSRLYLII